MFLLLYRVANQVLMRPDEYKAVFRKAVFRKAVFRWYTHEYNMSPLNHTKPILNETKILSLKNLYKFH